MVYQNLTGYLAIMIASAVMVLLSLFAISRYEQSWINWYTLPSASTLAIIYVLPTLFLLNFGTEGSYYAYFVVYLSYGLASAATAAGYLFLPPIRWKRGLTVQQQSLSWMPWILVVSAFLLYLPVLLEFREYILQPREIYIRTRTGYGLQFFGSTLLSNLAFISYLFKQRKSYVGGATLVLCCAVITFLHGSKGQLIFLPFIAVLYFVYCKGWKAGFVRSTIVLIPATALVAILFFVFRSSGDSVNLALQMATYSDYTRNAFKVIDNPESNAFLGQLEAEEEFYSRIPRLVMPNKPKAFGAYRLALQYFPGWFYSDTGSPAFGVGMQYADFGPFGIAVFVFGGLLNGWFARSAIQSFERTPTVGHFTVLIFFSGITILPLGTGYLLPESLILAATMDFMARSRSHVPKQASWWKQQRETRY